MIQYFDLHFLTIRFDLSVNYKMKAFLIVILVIVFASGAMATDVAKAFKDNEVEPDAVSVSPTKLVEVRLILDK